MNKSLMAVLSIALGGCAALSPDGGAGAVSALTRERTGQPVVFQRSEADRALAAQRVAELLSRPLGAEQAVELALLNNRALQAEFAGLGIAEADRVQAGRLANPGLSFSRTTGGGATELERGVTVGLLGLLTLPLADRVAEEQLDRERLRVAASAVQLAGEARGAHAAAVAAHSLVRYRAQVLEAAEATHLLARQMLQAGNFSKLEQMREQAFHADAVANLGRARHQAVVERERLVRLLGLGDEAASLSLPDHLPALPAEPMSEAAAGQAALERRLDLMMARRSVDATARALGLGRVTRFVDVLALGLSDRRETGQATRRGVEISFELPLFDFGATRVARAEAGYRQALHQAGAVAVAARSQLREQHSAYRTAHALARHYRDEVVPLRQRIADENLLRYNGMLISVFDLLAGAREQIAGVTAAIEAQRDFWIADARLQIALTGGTPSAGPSLAVAGAGATGAAGH